MFQSRSEYDRGVNTFSPEGRLFQIEYALSAVNLGTISVGIATNEGVVLAVERRINSPLMESGSYDKIWEIDSHVGCAMSGLTADARTLVEHARTEALNHTFIYDEPLPVKSCVSTVSNMALDFSDILENDSDRKKVMSRPFGVALLFAGVDKKGPQLYLVDPSGTSTRFHATAIGSAHEGAEAMLREQFNQQMTLLEAKKLALVVLRQVMEEKISAKNVEVACVTVEDKAFHMLPVAELEELLSSLPATKIPTADELAAQHRRV